LSATVKIPDDNLEELIPKLPEDEKTAFLLAFLKNELDLKIKLQKRLKFFIVSQDKESTLAKRTASQLRDLEVQVTKLYEEKLAEEQKAQRIEELKLLASKESILWQEITNSIQLKTQRGYDYATQLLRDLKELAVYLNKKEFFESKIGQIHRDYRKLSSFIRRLYEYELIK
jgi:hypothetical protein